MSRPNLEMIPCCLPEIFLLIASKHFLLFLLRIFYSQLSPALLCGLSSFWTLNQDWSKIEPLHIVQNLLCITSWHLPLSDVTFGSPDCSLFQVQKFSILFPRSWGVHQCACSIWTRNLSNGNALRIFWLTNFSEFSTTRCTKWNLTRTVTLSQHSWNQIFI